jgi:hypothetical protein
VCGNELAIVTSGHVDADYSPGVSVRERVRAGMWGVRGIASGNKLTISER